MEEGRLAYRVRTAEVDDAVALRDAIGSTLAHPDHQGRRESYRGAAARMRRSRTAAFCSVSAGSVATMTS